MKVSVKELNSYCIDVLKRVGMPQDEAEIFAEVLIQADQRGVKSHGVAAFGRYIKQIEDGHMLKKAKHTTVVDNPVIAVWDAHLSCAHVISYFAMKEAIEKARKYGIGFVGVRNSTHFGAGAYFTKQAADAGMIGIASSTAGPTMAPWGGTQKLIGNNPLSLSAPAASSPTVTLDMAQSVVAFGRIANLKTQGVKNIPEGWAFDKDGQPTTVTDDVYSLTPFGDYKGFGIALFVDIISGMLIGANTGPRCGGGGDCSNGHTFLAIDPSAFGISPDEFKKVLEDRIAEFKSSPKKAGADNIYMPGELEEICYNNSQVEAEIIDEVVDQLNELAERIGSPLRVSGVK